jgi:hypothetical protein
LQKVLDGRPSKGWPNMSRVRSVAAAQLAELMRARASEYESKAALSFISEGREQLGKTAATYRRIADLIETCPPLWLEAAQGQRSQQQRSDEKTDK